MDKIIQLWETIRMFKAIITLLDSMTPLKTLFHILKVSGQIQTLQLMTVKIVVQLKATLVHHHLTYSKEDSRYGI